MLRFMGLQRVGHDCATDLILSDSVQLGCCFEIIRFFNEIVYCCILPSALLLLHPLLYILCFHFQFSQDISNFYCDFFFEILFEYVV